MTDPDTPAADKTGKADFKLVSLIPATWRSTPGFVRFQSGLDWLSTPKGAKWGFGFLALLLAMINYLPSLNNPDHPYWDESYYVTSTQRYLEHEASFASHPPLGFMFMAAGAALVGDNAGLKAHSLAKVKKTRSEDMPKGYSFTGVRLPAALMAVTACVLFYLILLNLVEDGFMALVLGLMFIFENGFIVQFRAVQLDSYQITFVVAAILVWLRIFLDKAKRPVHAYALFGGLIGLSFMVKVNSGPVLALGGISLIVELWRGLARLRNSRSEALAVMVPILKKGVTMGVSFAAAIIVVFSLHVALNPNRLDPDSEAGKRDWGATSATYKAFEAHRRPLSVEVLWAASRDYIDYMHHDFTGEIKSEPNGQAVITWPWLVKAVSYRWDSDGKKTAYSLFIGNPVVWKLSLVGLITGASLILWRRWRKPDFLSGEGMDQAFNVMEAVMAMYLIFMVIHFYLGTQRVMYIYHYFIGLILSFMITALVILVLMRTIKGAVKYQSLILVGLALAITAGFSVYSPFSYHIPMTRSECEARNWPWPVISCEPKPKAAPPPLIAPKSK